MRLNKIGDDDDEKKMNLFKIQIDIVSWVFGTNKEGRYYSKYTSAYLYIFNN